MKADVRSQAEKEALDWAAVFFRHNRSLHPIDEPKQRRRQKERAWRSLLTRRCDACRHEEDIAVLVSTLTGGRRSHLSLATIKELGQAGGYPELRNYVADLQAHEVLLHVAKTEGFNLKYLGRVQSASQAAAAGGDLYKKAP